MIVITEGKTGTTMRAFHTDIREKELCRQTGKETFPILGAGAITQPEHKPHASHPSSPTWGHEHKTTKWGNG